MRSVYQIILLTAAALSNASVASAAEIKVIANPSLSAPSLSSDELKQVFLGTKTSFSDGSRAEPVFEKGGVAHEEFVKKHLGKTSAALETYFRSLVFTGRGQMPKAFASDAEVVSYVARTKGAIGYVSAAANAPGTKTVEVR